MSETIARLEKAALACQEIQLNGLAVLLTQAASELATAHSQLKMPLGWSFTKAGEDYRIASPAHGPGVRVVSESSPLHTERLLYALANDIVLTQALQEKP